ncbi:MAG: hypothetical protein J6W36_03910 [Clostridiales bacterium]|nr:hypothetical protein [Clostridiales bacterium]
MKILMINLPFAGHTNPTLPLTKELVRRGHEVTYINSEEFRGKIESCGARFVPYINYPERPSENDKKRKSFRALYDTVMSIKEHYDLLIYEMFFYPGAEIAKQKGIPCVRQFSQPAWNEETWKDAPLMFRTSARLIDIQVFPKHTAKELGFENRCLKDGIIRAKPELNIVYVPKQFQVKREYFGNDYVFKIPVTDPPAGNIKIPYEDMKHPIVYISLGSIISNRGFCKECIRAFGNKDFSVILNTGKIPADSLGNIPGNIFAYSFVPQIEVLSHADVFLTHCGMNSVNEALSLGVPMVAMPFINDQITNAEQIVRLGLGKRVRSFPSRGKELFNAVSEVYNDGSYRERANAMKAGISNQTGWDDVIGRIESLF